MIREARHEDLAAMAELHVASWRTTYRGLLPEDLLAKQEIGPRVESWGQFLAAPPEPGAALLVALDDGDVTGMARTGPSRLEGYQDPETAELYAIYVHPDRVGGGFGRALLGAALDRLRAAGYRRVVLSVLEGNRSARRFYEREGFSVEPLVQGRAVPGADAPIPHLVYQRVLEPRDSALSTP